MIQTLGIIGTGNVGGAVARRAAAVGIDVVVANSRGAGRLAGLVAELGGRGRAATPTDAARAGDLVVAAIPLRAYQQLPAAALAGKTVIDTMNYAPDPTWSVAALDDDTLTSSELVQRHLVGARVVKALHNFGPHQLEAMARDRGAADRTALPISGDDDQAKGEVAELLDRLGYDAVDIGGLAESWRSGPNTPLYALPYLPEIPEGLSTPALLEWIAGAPGVPAGAQRIRELAATTVRAPAKFQGL